MTQDIFDYDQVIDENPDENLEAALLVAAENAANNAAIDGESHTFEASYKGQAYQASIEKIYTAKFPKT